jgi:hypothetical protein
MKRRIILIVAVAIALVGSFYAGAYRERVAYDHFFMRSAYLHAANNAEQDVRVLTYLREGRTEDALSTLETLLDSSLTTFVRYDKAPASERGDFVLHAIQIAREYREKHPSDVSHTNAETTVQDILSLAK